MEPLSASSWRIIAISGIAVVLMTLFSYVVGVLRKKQFSQPVLLNELLQRLKVFSSITYYRNSAGWLIHYAVGLSFVICYHLLWSHKVLAPTLSNGAILGAVSGIIGVAGWHLILSIHPNPPNIDLKEYYLLLFVAHVIFGITATAGNLVINDWWP